MSQGFAGFLELLIGPPGGLILLMLAGFFMLQRHTRIGKRLIVTGIALLYLTSMPLLVNFLVSEMETPTTITKEDFSTPRAQAIVVLGSGRREYAPEFHLIDRKGDTLSAFELEFSRYAAWLARRTRLPILVSGGLADDDGPAEAVMMKDVLVQEFNQPVKWMETKSRNTYENAKFSAEKLLKDKIVRIYLVTDALSMKRAKWAFQQQGLEVIPAPTVFVGRPVLKLKNLLPSSRALTAFSYLFHEWVGNLWYHLRY